jgi:type I restriction enzyme S subunit
MVQSGHVGHTAVIPKELDKTAAHALIMFQNPSEVIDPYFINYQLLTDNSKSRLDYISIGNTIKHILASSMKQFIVSFPDYEEQAAIGNFFRSLDTLLESQQQELEKLQNIKKACLSRMFV